jgi:hypothetical protein
LPLTPQPPLPEAGRGGDEEKTDEAPEMKRGEGEIEMKEREAWITWGGGAGGGWGRRRRLDELVRDCSGL